MTPPIVKFHFFTVAQYKFVHHGRYVILIVYGIDDDKLDVEPINHGWRHLLMCTGGGATIYMVRIILLADVL